MNRLHQLVIAIAIVATPAFASAQGKATHAPPPVMGKSAPVRQDNRPEKIADKQARIADRTADKAAANADKTADKATRTADNVSDKAERATEKTERSELETAHEQKLLTKGIKLTTAEKKLLKAIEKKYDTDYRDLRRKEVAADKAARKNGTTESDAAFQTQLFQLKTQERAEMRAVLTAAQQATFDANIASASKRK
jgi:hypothetical protein